MREAGKPFTEDGIRRHQAELETKADHKMAEHRQRQKFTRNKPESRPRGVVTTIIHADGSVDHVDRDVGVKEAFGETGVSNISRKKDKAYTT